MQRVLAHHRMVSPGCDIPRSGLQPCQLPQVSSSGVAAWNESWNGPPGKRTVLSAAVALSCGIGAGSALKAWEHASCKRMLAVLDNAGSADQVRPLPPGIPAFAEARTAGCFRRAGGPMALL